jgi:opacity protein-like surface antigen
MTRAVAFATTFLLASSALAADAPGPGVELGARLGYAFSAGHVGAPPNGTDVNLGDYVGGQFPIWLDAGYRFNRELYLGGYFQYGFGVINDDRQDLCRSANVDCSASDLRLGIMGRYHLPLSWPLSPWVGLGIGYEWGSYSQHFSAQLLNNPNVDRTWSGFELANLQLGADYPIAHRVSLAPFVSVSLGQFRHLSTTTTIGNSSTTTDEDLAKTSLHEWILIGVRVAFAP